MFLPKERKVMSFHSLPGFQLLCMGRNLPQAPCHSHQSPIDDPVPAEHPQWCSVPLHGQLIGALVGSALQNQTLVQVGSAQWGHLHPDSKMSLFETGAALVDLIIGCYCGCLG